MIDRRQSTFETVILGSRRANAIAKRNVVNSNRALVGLEGWDVSAGEGFSTICDCSGWAGCWTGELEIHAGNLESLILKDAGGYCLKPPFLDTVPTLLWFFLDVLAN